MEWLDLALEEYKTLRQESLQAQSQQQTVLQFGLGTVGVLTGIGIQLRSDVTLSSLVLVGAVPLFATFAVVVWLGELERMVRAGAHIRTVELAISARFPDDPPLHWETDLFEGARTNRRRVVYRYRAVLVVLLTLAIMGLALGLIGLARKDHWVAFACGLTADTLVLGTLGWWYRLNERRLTRLGTAAEPAGAGPG